ncbi:MAG: FAD-binding oxidoreductase [Pseudomonadota bacterium]|nr:FAD-binding oxidoreductase [Pseudomonadota bacterium]
MHITLKRDLRDGKPVWLHSPPRIQTSTFPSDHKADVVIVGTGVSGALMADALQRAGYSVLALDRRGIMSGSTPASTALLQSELDIPLIKLQKLLDKTHASRAWLRSAQSLRNLQSRIEDLNIACDLRSRDTIYLPGNILDTEGLRQEGRAREKLGLRSRFVDRQELRELSGLRKAGALVTAGNADVNPVKLVAGLWRHFVARGGKLISHTEVTDVDQSRNRVKLQLADGRRIIAQHAVFCTGYEITKKLRPKGYKVISTWVLATKPQAKHLWKGQSLIWEASDPYLYMRSTVDGRIIAGGEDEEFADEEIRNALMGKKIVAIARKAKALLPQADFSAEFSWTGCFGTSPHSLPAVGPIPGLPRCYSVLGFGGNGITFSMLAAELVSRHIQGIADPDAEIFKL